MTTQIQISIDNCLSLEDAQKELGISTMTLWRWRKAGNLVSITVNHHAYIPKYEVERLNAIRHSVKKEVDNEGGMIV